jgi:hypothetical protein
MTITEDPVFLTEPLVKTTNLLLNTNAGANQYQAWLFCQADDEVPGRDPAWVPHFLPGTNPYLTEFADLNQDVGARSGDHGDVALNGQDFGLARRWCCLLSRLGHGEQGECGH